MTELVHHRFSDLGRAIADGWGVRGPADIQLVIDRLKPDERLQCLLAALVEQLVAAQPAPGKHRARILECLGSLPVRVQRILRTHCETNQVEYMDQIDPISLRWLHGVGPATLRVIIAWAAGYGVSLKDPGPAFGPLFAEDRVVETNGAESNGAEE